MSERIRLDKYLAETGGSTRSQARDYIKKGKVCVDGQVIKKPEEKIDWNSQEVSLEGRKLSYQKYAYYMLNKPDGVLSACSDKNTATVLDLLPEQKRKELFPVGRLDKDTEGLLLLTNDGELAHRLLSPRKHVEKVYYVVLDGGLTEETVMYFAEGMPLGDFTAQPANLQILSSTEQKAEALVTICEGKFHQVKRMFSACGLNVTYLKRLSMGSLLLDETLKPGEYRELTEEEILQLRKETKIIC